MLLQGHLALCFVVQAASEQCFSSHVFVPHHGSCYVAATGSSESGWDVFSLRYDLTAPLSTIFSAPVMAQYQRVFRLLWRLKRVEHGLGGAWTCLKVSICCTVGITLVENSAPSYSAP